MSGTRLFPAFIILTMLQYRKTAPILVTRVDEKTLSCLSRYKHEIKHAGQSRKLEGYIMICAYLHLAETCFLAAGDSSNMCPQKQRIGKPTQHSMHVRF